MNKLFDYPAEGWGGVESSFDAGFLVLAMFKVASNLGIKTKIQNTSLPNMLGWDKILYFSGVRIEFTNQDYGCSLNVVISNEKIIDVGFFFVWKYFIDKGIFWGGPCKKDLTVKDKEANQQAEVLSDFNNKESKEIKKRNGIAFRWLSRKEEFVKKTLPNFLDEYRDVFPSDQSFRDWLKKMLEADLIDKPGKYYQLIKRI